MSPTLTFNPLADTYLDRTSPPQREVNFGGDSVLRSGSQLSAILRFHIQGLPQGATVQSASLEIVKAGSTGTGTSYLREMDRIGWTEYGATDAMAVFDTVFWACGEYNPYDNSTGFGSGLDYAATNLSTLQTNSSDPNGTLYTFASTTAFVNLLQCYVNISEILDICIPFGAGLTFYSRSGATSPALKVQYALSPPQISSFSPLSTSSTGITITVYGSNFGTGSSSLDSIQLTNQGPGSDYTLTNKTWVISQEVKGDVPAEALPGTYIIRVTISGQSADSQGTFAFNDPGPSISSLSPANAKVSQGHVLTINGSNFNSPVTQVALVGQANQGEKSPDSFTLVSTTQITASLPTNLPIGPYRVRVVADGNSTLSEQTFSSVVGPVVW